MPVLIANQIRHLICNELRRSQGALAAYPKKTKTYFTEEAVYSILLWGAAVAVNYKIKDNMVDLRAPIAAFIDAMPLNSPGSTHAELWTPLLSVLFCIALIWLIGGGFIVKRFIFRSPSEDIKANRATAIKKLLNEASSASGHVATLCAVAALFGSSYIMPAVPAFAITGLLYLLSLVLYQPD